MKKRKSFFIILVCILLVLTCFNFDKIKFVFSFATIYLSELNHEDTKDKNISEAKNPLSDLALVTEEEIVINPQASEEVDGNIDTSTGSQNIDATLISKNAARSQVTKQSHPITSSKAGPSSLKKESNKSLITIASNYNEKFESLQDIYLLELNHLISQASKDYNGSIMSTNEITSTYITKGSELEKSCDLKMNMILKDLKLELKANGHKLTLVDDIKSYYNSFKKSKKREVLNKAKKYK